MTTMMMMLIMIDLMMMSLGVSAQPTVNDDDAYCQSRTLEELVKEIRADIKTSCQPSASARGIQQMKEEFITEVKNLLGSRQQPCAFNVADWSALGEFKTCSLLIGRYSRVTRISDWGHCGIP